MSALLVVRKAACIEVLSDAGEWCVESGALTWIGEKQAMPPDTPAGTLVASIGWLPAAAAFIRLANARCANFDAVRDHALEMWREVEAAIHPEMKTELIRTGIDYGVFFCGWSERQQRLQAFTIDPAESPDLWETDTLLIAPGDSHLIDDITAKLTANPEAFDPETDGVEIMEMLRRSPRQFGQGSFSAVGGFIQYTTATATGGNSRILRHWDDRVGEPILLAEHELVVATSVGVRAAPSRAPDISATAPALR